MISPYKIERYPSGSRGVTANHVGPSGGAWVRIPFSLHRSEFSHKELHGLHGGEMKEKLLEERGIDWYDTAEGYRRGRMIIKDFYEADIPEEWKKDGEDKVMRSHWISHPAFDFLKTKLHFQTYIPKLVFDIREEESVTAY